MAGRSKRAHAAEPCRLSSHCAGTDCWRCLSGTPAGGVSMRPLGSMDAGRGTRIVRDRARVVRQFLATAPRGKSWQRQASCRPSFMLRLIGRRHLYPGFPFIEPGHQIPPGITEAPEGGVWDLTRYIALPLDSFLWSPGAISPAF